MARIRKCALKSLRDVGLDLRIRWLIVDVDNPHHEAHTDVTTAFARACESIDRVPGYEGATVYLTSHGHRLLWPLDEDGVTPEQWRDTVSGVLLELHGWGIEGDIACRDWTRLFRLPKVRRGNNDVDLPMRLVLTGTP